MDWDAAYDNSAAVPEAAAMFARWAERSTTFRESAPAELDRRYGPHPRERLDLFAPPSPAGAVLWIHGGYWKAFDKDASSWLAAGPLARGWAFAAPSYPLCPEVRIADIARSVARAVEAAATRVAGPLILAGHSAGGHLALRLVCADGLLRAETLARVRRAVSVSGLSDLRPLMRTAMNATLRIDEAEAQAESPALLRPAEGVEALAWVGAAELPEFRRQSALIANVWTGLGARATLHEAPGGHHFDVIDPLAEPDSELTRALLA
jgi:acetyl esterase/lipase